MTDDKENSSDYSEVAVRPDVGSADTQDEVMVTAGIEINDTPSEVDVSPEIVGANTQGEAAVTSEVVCADIQGEFAVTPEAGGADSQGDVTVTPEAEGAGLPGDLAVTLEVGSVVDHDAVRLDKEIRERAQEFSNLAITYLRLGALLTTMRETKQYRFLGYPSWEFYLDSIKLSRSYLSWILKLGRAGDLEPWVDRGLGASMLMEYAKLVGIPEKIPEVIEATFETVYNKPVREARTRIAQYVEAHPGFKKPSIGRVEPRRRLDTVIPIDDVSAAPSEAVDRVAAFKSRAFTEYRALSTSDRIRFTEALQGILDELQDLA